jgi:thymidylate synthase (FAD)
MTNISGYSDVEVFLLDSTKNPKDILEMALNITMKQDFSVKNKNLEKLIKSIIDMNHTSPLEHLNYNFLIKNASRSFLSQITRHRIASYTSGSTHYQDYSNYGFKIADEFKDNPIIKETVNNILESYKKLILAGIPQSEVRQLLPLGIENNLMYSTNARSLINFLNLRLCERNTGEIKIVAHKIYDLVYPTFPELWKNIGPDCYMKKSCSQGKMKCSGGYKNGPR